MKIPLKTCFLSLVLLVFNETSVHAFYDPGMQRWLNRDPIAENGAIDMYQFVLNDPIHFYDLLGLNIGIPTCGYGSCPIPQHGVPYQPNPNCERAQKWLQKCHPEIAPSHYGESLLLKWLNWDGLGLPYSRMFGGMVLVAPGLSAEDCLGTLAHEGMHTVVGPRWGTSHDDMQDQARDIEREYWADPEGKNCKCKGNHYGAGGSSPSLPPVRSPPWGLH